MVELVGTPPANGQMWAGNPVKLAVIIFCSLLFEKELVGPRKYIIFYVSVVRVAMKILRNVLCSHDELKFAQKMCV